MQQWLFVDGSGKPRQDRYLSYCGYLVWAEDADAFFDKWNAVLGAEQLPYFSMKDANRWDDVFAKKKIEWGDEAEARREKLFFDLADSVVTSRVFGFGYAVNGSTFKDKQIEPSEYFMFVRLLETLWPHMESIAALAIVADDEESCAERIYGFFRKLRRQKPQMAQKIKMVGIGDDKSVPGLQAADMLAQTLVKELKRKTETPEQPETQLWHRLMHQNGGHAKSISHEQLYVDPQEFLKIAGIY